MLRSDTAIEFLRRRPWQRRIEVYSPKIQRRLTLFSRDAHDTWLLCLASYFNFEVGGVHSIANPQLHQNPRIKRR
jgi:hypothetical protein